MSTAPHLSSLSVLPVGPKLFTMERHTGRWVFLDASEAAALRLVDRHADSLPEEERRRRQAVVDRLHDAKFGLDTFDDDHNELNTVILKLTKVCNFRCTYCYDMEPEDAHSHLPLPVALKSLREAIEIARRPARNPQGADLTVILHGGEPTLMFPMIKTLVLEGEACAEQHGKRIRFCGQTNMSRLTPEFVEFSHAHQVMWGVSLDGPEALNDRFRILANGRGTYSYFAQALDQYPEFVTQCYVLTVVTSNNQGRLLEIARHFRDCGLPGWGWTLFQAIGQARQDADGMQFSVTTVLESWNALLEAIEGGEFDGFDVRPVSSYLKNLVLGPGSNMCMRKHCGAGRDLLSVSHDGTIEACDCIDRKGPFAGLANVQYYGANSLQVARATDKAALIRSRDVQVGQCATCIWLSVCGGTCLAYAPSIHGVHEDHCRIAMHAFTQIVRSLGSSAALRRYWESLRPQVPGVTDLRAGADAAAVAAGPMG